MKIKFTETPRCCWYPWFAWYPVMTRERNGKRHLVWLERIERYDGWDGWSRDFRVSGE